MNILIVLSGTVDLSINEILKQKSIDHIVAVDGGYDYLQKENINPNVTIGDFDSVENKVAGEIIKLNKEKDFTDFEETLKYISSKFEHANIYVLGFMSLKRPEHFYNNLNLIQENITFLSKETEIFLLNSGQHTIKYPNYISFFAFEKVEGLTLEGFKYPLKNKTLKIHESLCISNELEHEEGEVSFKSGSLLVFLSN